MSGLQVQLRSASPIRLEAEFDCGAGELVALVGPARAKLILMAGEKIEAEEALAMGLIDRIVEAEALMQTARGLASDVLAAKPGHAAAIKRMVG